jgi:hypothetical protein
MVSLTLFEIHLDDASFESNAPFADTGSGGAEASEESASEPEGESGGGPSLVALVAGLLFLVAIAALVRKLRGGDGEETPPESDSFETDVEAA